MHFIRPFDCHFEVVVSVVLSVASATLDFFGQHQSRGGESRDRDTDRLRNRGRDTEGKRKKRGRETGRNPRFLIALQLATSNSQRARSKFGYFFSGQKKEAFLKCFAAVAMLR